MTDDALGIRLLGIFVEELGEQVQQLNEHLLALERAPADAGSLTNAFRVMHTLKGAARAASVPEVERLCHLLEADLARARDRAIPLGGATIAILFEAADALGDARDRLAAGTSLAEGPIATVLDHLRARGDSTGAADVRSTRIMSAPSASSPATPPVAPEPPLSPVPRRIPVPEPQPAGVPATAIAAVAPTPRVTAEPDRDELVRVGMHQVEAISNAAGEVTGLAAVLADRAEELSALRQQVRSVRAEPAHRDDATLREVDREITRLLRRAGDDARLVGAVSGRLSGTARRLRQRSLRELTETLPRVVRDLAHDLGKEVQLIVSGAEIEADRVVVEALREPLLHLMRNGADHGLESPRERELAGKPAQGTIRLSATLRGDRLRVAVADDGRGLDQAAIGRVMQQRGRTVPADAGALRHAIFEEGFSTRAEASALSGRGVGLGIVRGAVERVGGSVEVESVPGQGTTFVLEVPLSIATLRVLTVTAGGSTFGIPSAYIARVDRVQSRRVARVDGRAMLTTADAPTPLVTLAAILGPPFADAAAVDVLNVVTVEVGGRRLALVVDELHDERELVLRPLEHAGAAASAITVGSALLGDGDVALVLGVAALVDAGSGTATLPLAHTERFEPSSKRVLVVDDSMTSRALEQSVLAAAGYDVVTAVDGAEGWRVIERGSIALVISDVEMPHLDGIALCERIRGTPRTASLPVILVTSLDEPAQRARGMDAGADAYVTKSGFDQDVLLGAVRRLLGAAPAVPAVPATSAVPT